MKKIPCELRLANGGDIVTMLHLDEQGILHIPLKATYGSFLEGVLSYRVMQEDDQRLVLGEAWQDIC